MVKSMDIECFPPPSKNIKSGLESDVFYAFWELSIELPGYGMYTLYTCLPSGGINGAEVARNYTQRHKIHISKDVQIAKKHVNQVIKSMQ